MLELIKKYKLIVTVTLLLFGVKIATNSLLLAENGDTYDFFKIAYFLQQFNLDYTSKRMPFLPLLLAPFPSQYFVEVGRFWINIFYFLIIIFSYKYFYSIINDKSKFLKFKVFKVYKVKFRNFYLLCFTLVIATNILIFENSFYILADTIFLFFNILYLYLIKKDGLSKPIKLSLVSALAFYTRPEGAVLFVITGILYILKSLKKQKTNKLQITNTKKQISRFITYGVTGIVLVAPYFIRNYIYYDSIFYSGYLQDEAGFLFDKVTVMLRLSNFLYAVGGVWLLPTLYIIFRSLNNKFSIWDLGFKILNVDLNNSLLLEALVFIIYSLTFFIWGPYPRLYSIPTFLILTFIYIGLKKINQIKLKWLDIVTILVLFGISILFYVYTVQFLDQTDYGYRKFGKAISIVFSAPVLLYFYLYFKQKISKKNLILAFTITLVVLNLIIFVDKFRITRFKYYTIKQAAIFATMPGVSLGTNIYYSSGSGLETWYFKDFSQEFFYKDATDPQIFTKNVEENNVTLYITTGEMGYKDNLSNVSIDKISAEVLQEYKSPFFSGSTKVIQIKY